MKHSLRSFSVLFPVVLLSCAPVLRQERIDSALRDIVLSDRENNSGSYRGQLSAMGGIIEESR
ncbi:MAG: hypothetical protein ACOYVJ_12075 [Nitrospirota bacterium]